MVKLLLIPTPKSNQVEGVVDLRPISLVSLLSKILESSS